MSSKDTKNKKRSIVSGISLSVLLLAGCVTPEQQTQQNQDDLSNVVEEVITTTQEPPQVDVWSTETVYIDDRTTATHSNNIDPNFDEVFADDEVKRIDIVIDPSDREIMQQDMIDNYGEQGVTTTGGRGGVRPTGGGGGGNVEQIGGINVVSDDAENPITVEAQIFYDDTQWYNVGIRYKGNSSLTSTWSSNNGKLSFKLDFDEFEDLYPDIKNQRFFGFKQLSLKNNYADSALIREKVASDIFMDSGIATAHTAFYEVYVDYGDGPIYFGLYTMVEEVDDTVIETQFEDGSGNLYKPDGEAATFIESSYDEDGYVKQTNEDENDFSDIQAFLDILHDDTRIIDPSTWRDNLDAVFDTDVFLHYLAINNVIQNRDTYGGMTHNYYLYNNPETNKLTRIPRDNNEAFQDGKRAGALELDLSNLTTGARPIIEYIYQDDVYREIYNGYVQDITDNAFDVETIQAKYDFYAELLTESAAKETDGYTFLRGESGFTQAIETLKQHAVQQNLEAEQYLESQGL